MVQTITSTSPGGAAIPICTSDDVSTLPGQPGPGMAHHKPYQLRCPLPAPRSTPTWFTQRSMRIVNTGWPTVSQELPSIGIGMSPPGAQLFPWLLFPTIPVLPMIIKTTSMSSMKQMPPIPTMTSGIRSQLTPPLQDLTLRSIFPMTILAITMLELTWTA